MIIKYLLVNPANKLLNLLINPRIILLPIVLIISSSVDAQIVAPLKLGNSWIYDDGYSLYKQTIVDTNVVIYSTIYCEVNIKTRTSPQGYSEFVRLNEDSFYVWWTFYGGGKRYQSPYYKLNAQFGESWINPLDSNGVATVINVYPLTVFSEVVLVKVVHYSGELNQNRRSWTEEFGMHTQVNLPFGEVVASMNGCIIDGVAYGDTSFYLVNVFEENEVITNFKLYQNFPNPFNPVTNIEYFIPEPTNVNLTIYNSLGAKIAILVNEYQTSDKYQVQFHANDLSNGTYFYVLRTGEYIQTKKMLLLK